MFYLCAMERDSFIQQARLHIDLPPTTAGSIEDFQNTCLRPLLKWHHHFWSMMFDAQLGNQKLNYERLLPAQQTALLRQVIQKDPSFKYQLVGVVTGWMTLTEYTFYVQHKTEINKRILAMIVQRVQNQWADATNG